MELREVYPEDDPRTAKTIHQVLNDYIELELEEGLTNEQIDAKQEALLAQYPDYIGLGVLNWILSGGNPFPYFEFKERR